MQHTVYYHASMGCLAATNHIVLAAKTPHRCIVKYCMLHVQK